MRRHGVTYSQAAALLGYTPDALLDEIVDAFAAGDGNGVFAGIDKVIEVGQDPRRFAEDLLRRLRDLIIVAAVPDALTSGLVDVAVDQADRLRGQATTIGPGELTRAAEVIAAGLTDMRGTTAPRLHLELMCARVLLPAADAGERGVHARLDRLERRLAMTSPEAHGKPTATAAESPAGQGEGRHPGGRDEPGRGRSAEQRSADQRRAADQRGVEQGSAEGRPTEQRDAEQVVGGTPPRPPGRPAGRPQSTQAAATNGAATATPASAAGAAPTGPQDAPPADVPTDPKDAPPAELPTADASPTADAAPTRPQDAPLAEASHANSPATALAETSTVETVARSAGDGSALTTIDFRSLWPDILAEVKNRRRFTWILLSQNAHVVDVVDGVLSLGMSNPGARDSFGRGGSEDVLREAILQVTATQVRVQVVVEPGQAAEPAALAPRPEPARAQRPAAAAQARDNIRSTSTTVEPPPVEEQPSREDASVEEEGGNHDELLAKHLGAELIAEED